MDFSEILSTKTFKHSLVTIAGTVSNGALGILFFITLARNLGAQNFGLVSLSIATLTLLADIGDLGISTGLINFISKSIDKTKIFSFMKLALKTKLMIWMVILTLGWIVAPIISNSVFLKNELVFPLRLSMVGVGGALLFSFITYSAQALQRYTFWSLINIATNAVRLAALIFLIFLNQLSTTSALLDYILVLFGGFFIGLIFLPRFMKVKTGNDIRGEFFNYNKWVASTIIIAAVSTRLDSYLSARFLTLREVGIYSVATQLSSIVPQLSFAIASVVAPKLASFDTNKKAIEYLKKLQAFVVGIAILGLIVVPASFLIPIIYGYSYSASVAPFIILYLGQLVFFICIPAHQAIFYYFSKPNFFFVVTLLHLVINFSVGVSLIPSMGIIGAALTSLIGNLFLFLLPSFYVIRKLR